MHKLMWDTIGRFCGYSVVIMTFLGNNTVGLHVELLKLSHLL